MVLVFQHRLTDHSFKVYIQSHKSKKEKSKMKHDASMTKSEWFFINRVNVTYNLLWNIQILIN